jgi:hypothetical protein
MLAVNVPAQLRLSWVSQLRILQRTVERLVEAWPSGAQARAPEGQRCLSEQFRGPGQGRSRLSDASQSYIVLTTSHWGDVHATFGRRRRLDAHAR